MKSWEELEQEPEYELLPSKDRVTLHDEWRNSLLSSLADEDPEAVDAAGVNRFVATERARSQALKTGKPFNPTTAEKEYSREVEERTAAQKQALKDYDELERAKFALRDAESAKNSAVYQDTFVGEGAKTLNETIANKKQGVAQIESRFTPEMLQQVKEVREAEKGERPTAVLGSDLYTDPSLLLDKDRYRSAVAESNASPESKARAMAEFAAKRKQFAEEALRTLRIAGESPIPGAQDFPTWEASQPEGVRSLSPEDKALQYMREMQKRGDIRKLTSAIGTGLLQGGTDIASQGLGVAAMIADSGALAEKAAEVAEGAQTLEEVSKLEGDKQATGATTLGGAARLVPSAAATIAPAALTGGASLGISAALAGAQTAGAQFPTTYTELRKQGMSEQDALNAARNSAIASGIVTAGLTAAFGKTGMEAALGAGAGGKELVKSRLVAAMKAVPKGAAAEIPEELLDEMATQVIEQRTIDPTKPVSQIVDEFAETAPDLAMQIALLGGAGGAVGGYRGSTTQPKAEPEAAPADDFAQRAAMEGATEYRAPEVKVEGVTIATINPESGWTPEDVLDFANSPEDLATLARNKIITLPEVVAPIEGVDPAITDEMNERLAASAALAPQTVEALKAAPAPEVQAETAEPIVRQELEAAEAPVTETPEEVKPAETLGVTPPPAPTLEAPEGAARNADTLRQAAARAAGTEQGPRIGFIQSPSTAVTAETETPSSTANAAGGSQSVQTEPAEGSIPAVTEDIVSTSDIPSTPENQAYAPDQLRVPESIREEPAQGATSREAEEAGARDSVLRAAEERAPQEIVTPQGEAPTTATEGQPMPGGSSEWSPTVGQPATANINGQKIVGTVGPSTGKGLVSFQYEWNGKTQKATVRPDRLSRPVASLTEPPRYEYTQEQNTRKAGKHFPTAPGLYVNHDFRKSFASMAEDTSLSRIYRQIAKVMSKMPAFENMDLHIVADGRRGYAGEYSHSNGKSAIAVNLRQVARGKVDALGTILHEALHHITLAKVRSPQGTFESDIVQTLDQIRQRVVEYAKQQGLDKKLDYEIGTNEEFISAIFTRPDFQNLLASIPDSFAPGVSVGRFRSVLSEIFRLIAELVTGEMVAKGSTMEQAMTTVLALFETPHRTLDIGKLEKLSAVRSKPGYRTPADMLAEAAQKAKGEVAGAKPQGLASMFKPQAKRPATGERKLLDMPVRNTLADAYREAVRGSGTQFAPLSSVYAQARLLQPGLTPDEFLAQVQEGYDNGTLLLEGAGSQQEATQAGLSLPGTPVGTAVRMMPAPETPKSLVDEDTDAAYMAAVEAGDMETAQKMVDAAAKAAGYSVQGWHGTRAKFTTFAKGDIGFHFGLSEDQVSGPEGRFSNSPPDSYRTIKAWIKADNSIRLPDTGNWDGWRLVKEVNSLIGSNLPENATAKQIRDALTTAGYDSASYENLHEGPEGSEAVIVFGPNQIKSADPVTRDEAGNVIPLSQRFNPESPSTLYSLAEEGGEPPAIDIGGEAEPADGKGKQLFQKEPTALGDTYITPADITLQEKKTQQETLDAARAIIGEEIAKNPNNTMAGRRAALNRFRLDTSIPPEVRAVGTGVIAQQADRMANLSEGNDQLLLDEMADEAAKLSGIISSDLESWKNLKADANLQIDKMAEEAGRTLNIFNVFRRLTPEGFLRRMTRKFNDAVREKVEQNFDVPAGEVEAEIMRLWKVMQEAGATARGESIAAALKAFMPSRVNTRKILESLFPQADTRDRMSKGGEALVRSFFQMMTGPRDQKGPLAEFDESIQSALSGMLRKAMEAKGLVSENQSRQATDIDKLVRAISADELRFDKIAAADEAMQKELESIEDPERRAVLQQAWEEATAKMYTNIASDSTVRRALNAELKSANVDWRKMFDANQKPDAIKAKTVNAVMAKIEALLTDPKDPTVRANLGMLRGEVEAAFDFIAANKRTEWLAYREGIDARRRVAEHRAAFMEALRNQGVAEQAINRISEKLAGPQRGKPDQNPVSELVGEHMKAPVADFVDKMVALDVDRATAESLDKAASTLRSEVAAAEKLKAAERAVAQLMKSLKPKPRAPREKIEKSLKALFTAADVGALDSQEFFDAFGEAFGMPPLSGEQQTKIKKLIREVNALPKGPARLDKQQELDEELALWKGIAARDVLLSAWYANVLSGISTQGMGILGNLFNFIPRSLFMAVTNPRSAAAYFKGAFGEGLETGIKEAKAAMKGRGLYKVSKYGDKNLVSALELLRKKGPATLPEWIAYISSAGTRLRYVFRIMQAIDALAWNTAREGHAYLAAHRALLDQQKATGEKRSPEEFYRQFIENLGGDTAQIEEDLKAARASIVAAGGVPDLLTVDRMAREARNARRSAAGVKADNRFADRIVLQLEPEGSGAVISSLIDVIQKKLNVAGLPLGQLLVPFNKIVSNLFEQSLDYTPVGALRSWLGGHITDVESINWDGSVKFKDKTTQFDAVERRERLAASITGTLIASAMYAVASAFKDEPDEDVPFMIYGWGPESKTRRSQMPKGWVPYSVKWGDSYFKFSEMPFGLMFAAAGNALDAMRYKNMDKKSSAQRLAYILKTSAKGFMSQGVLSSLDTAMETLMFQASDKKISDLPVNAAKGLIPAQGMLRDMSVLFDPTKISDDTLAAAFLRDMPFVKSLGTRPELNVFGEPVTFEGRLPLVRRIATRRQAHPLSDFLGRNKLTIPGMEPTIEVGQYLPTQMKDRLQRRAVEIGAMENGMFTPEQNYTFKKRAGELTKAAVEAIMQQAPKIESEAQRENLQKVINKRVESARRRAMLEAVPAQ